ncbi:MAG: hypothetical protein V9E95_04085 [Methanothrix soehngenii]
MAGLPGQRQEGWRGLDSKFLRDLIAGRPVFSHPSPTGGLGVTAVAGRGTPGLLPRE